MSGGVASSTMTAWNKPSYRALAALLVTFSDRLRAAGYFGGSRSWRVGEALRWSWGRRASAVATVAAWMRSTPHRQVLLEPRYREVGVGVVDGDPFAGGGTTCSAELGVRSR